ncbi:MAG: VWA domain-containing protein [Nitrospira sp.]|nr:VWA domain-containing protein [Nitrospira sp.]
MDDHLVRHVLVQRLGAGLGLEAARVLVGRVEEVAEEHGSLLQVTALLDELETVSAKVTETAIDALPALDRCGGLGVVVPWLDMGLVMAESSGATALRYFKESPALLSLLEADERRHALTVGRDMADRHGGVAMEFLRAAPDLFRVLPVQDIGPWLEIGLDLATVDAVVGLEYVRQLPQVAPILRLEDVRLWLSVGLQLVTTNTWGKPDYLVAIEFLRTSPAVLRAIPQPAVRSAVLSLVSVLARHSPESAVEWLAESPQLLSSLPSDDRPLELLRYGLMVANRDAEATILYLRRAPEVMKLMGEGLQASSRFEEWFKAGMEVLTLSLEGGRAYFGVDSQQALASVEQAMAGVSLRRIARRLKLFVEGLCGSEVSIAALPESTSGTQAHAKVNSDGRTILLPAVMNRGATAEDNERWYLVMAAHEAGHVQFGTYRVRLAELTDMIHDVIRRYDRTGNVLPETLKDLFALYPHPALVLDLWTIVEDARVDFLLQTEYPGLRRDLARLAAEMPSSRRCDQPVTVTELIVESLWRLSMGEALDTAVPRAIKAEVSALWLLCQPLFRHDATAADAIRLADALYVKIEEKVSSLPTVGETNLPTEKIAEEGQDEETTLREAERLMDKYRPFVIPPYRGEMDPTLITWEGNRPAQDASQESEASQMDGGRTTESGHRGKSLNASLRASPSMEVRKEQGGASSIEQELGRAEDEAEDEGKGRSAVQTVVGKRFARYPEWDTTIGDYRLNRCLVIEQQVAVSSHEDITALLNKDRSTITSLRKLFERLRPVRHHRVSEQAEGEEPDLDALVRRAADLRAGQEGSERVYVRWDKRDRSVAAAFLIDISGSTSKRLDSGRRVIDVEKESLVVLCEALEAVGDDYGLYAYSGKGAAAVDFFVLKDFGERLRMEPARRLGMLVPQRQNRDGAAIRHASAKLLKRNAKHRLLILVSDGKPLDGDTYHGTYAVEDTKKALQEARRLGIVPFCVIIGQEATEFQQRLYGGTWFTIVDRVESLPTRLPNIYRRLTA